MRIMSAVVMVVYGVMEEQMAFVVVNATILASEGLLVAAKLRDVLASRRRRAASRRANAEPSPTALSSSMTPQ